MTTYPAHLEAFSPALQRVLREWPCESAEEVLDAVGRGTAQLWDPGDGGVIVSRLIQEPERLVCLVWLASGKLDPLLKKYADIEAWARAQGADRMRIQGRAGWLRVLEGYEKTAVVMEKDLG